MVISKGDSVRVLAAARRVLGTLPRGAVPVGAGLIVLGVTSYGFLFVAAHSLTPRSFAGLSVLYVLVYTVGPGMFLPFEQEVGRALSDRRVRGMGGGPLLRRALVLGAVVLLVMLAGIVVAGPAIIGRLFDGSGLLLGGLLLSVVGLWGAHLSRGTFAGNDQFNAYGAQLATEGVVRLVASLVLAAAGVRLVGAYGLLLGGAFVVSVLATARFLPSLGGSGPEAPWEELTGALGWLVAGSLLAQVLVNAGPVAVKLLATSADQEAAGQLLAGLVLARLPLFLFAAVQAALLPRLAALIGRGQLAEFVTGIQRLLLSVAALAATTVILLGVGGPTVLRLLFGEHFHLGRSDLMLLSAATGFFMAANVMGNALLAMQRFGLAAAGWAAGVTALLGLIAVPASLFARVERSFLLGTVVTVVVFGALLRHAVRGQIRTAVHARGVVDVVTGP